MEEFTPSLFLLLSITAITWAIAYSFIEKAKSEIRKMQSTIKNEKHLHDIEGVEKSNTNLKEQDEEFNNHADKVIITMERTFYWIWIPAAINVTGALIYFEIRNFYKIPFASIMWWWLTIYYIYNVFIVWGKHTILNKFRVKYNDYRHSLEALPKLNLDEFVVDAEQ